MWDAAGDLAVALEGVLADLAGAVAGASPGWIVLGVLLHLANQVTRGRGWFALVRTASGGDPRLRRRDAIAAWVAVAGAGGVASARGGDAVRVLLLRRRLGATGCPVLAGTLVAEGAGEAVVGVLLLSVALAVGVGPDLGAPPLALGGALAAVLVTLLIARRVVLARHAPAARGGRAVAAVRRVCGGLARGCAPLRSPAAYAVEVLPWQLASRACRIAALACFLAAFALPVTPVVLLLVLFAQGSGRLVPFAPASVGAGAAVLAASFETVAGSAVPAERLAAFYVGTSTVLTVVGILLALVLSVPRRATAAPMPYPSAAATIPATMSKT